VAFRLVVSDIDGTLLDSQGVLRAETREAVMAVGKAGISFALATSRRWTGALPVAQALGLSIPLIIYDGIQTRQFPGGEVLDELHLDSVKAVQAALIMAKHHLQPILQYGDRHSERLVVGLLPDGQLHSNHAVQYLSNFASQVQEVPLEDLARLQPNPLRLVAFGLHDHLLAAGAEIAVLECGWQVLPYGSYGAAELSVFAPSASKGTATAALCRKLGISREEVLAIGDGPNDVSLLSAAGFGVAMANGSQDVKAIAQAIAPSNQENGVAVAISRYVFSNSATPLP
jgi:hydroxymethylpyrimidine pyrophosphatase-like HAD family hydrolase